MKKKSVLVTAVCAVAVVALLGKSVRKAAFHASVRAPREFRAAVTGVEKAGEGQWFVRKSAVARPVGGNEAYLFRLEKLRAKKVYVIPAGSSGENMVVTSGRLASGDLILVDPESIHDGAAVSVSSGLDERALVQLTIDAAIAAVNDASLNESMRFVSSNYSDPLGFDFELIAAFLSRAYKEFSNPYLEVVDSPSVEIQGKEAVIRGSIRLQAGYRGRRNYLLGGRDSSNTIWMRMEKLPAGWKLVELRGLRPLGFDERFMKLLGAEVGLRLSTGEKAEKEQFCMPCRSKMAEKFRD